MGRATPVPEGARRELLVHGGVGVLGALVAVAVVGVAVPTLLWRTAAIAAAGSLVVAGLVGAVLLARAEWRRERPAARRYAGVVARFLAAFLILVVATG